MIESDYKEKFPVPVLSPGAEVGVLAGFTFGSASAFDVKLTWEKENGSVAEEETFVAL